MVKVIRCDYCGSNIELQELDNQSSYEEEFVKEGCEASGCSGDPNEVEGIPDYLQDPDRLAYEAVFGDVELEEGVYTLEEVEEDGE